MTRSSPLHTNRQTTQTGLWSCVSWPSRPDGAPKFFIDESNTHCSPPCTVHTPDPHQKDPTHSPAQYALVILCTRFYSAPAPAPPPPPTVQELRLLARVPRKKSPCPDGVPPYLLASLPDAVFAIVHKCVVLCCENSHIPEPWLVSETFCIFKGKGQWQDPTRWRPIAMSNSIYGLLMRWIYQTLYPLITPQLHPRQFGGRQRSSTAHATQTFLDDLDSLPNIEAILAFDVDHAFDSPPKYLIYQTLQRMGTPTKLLLLFCLVLERGATFLRGAEDAVFTTTHGLCKAVPSPAGYAWPGAQQIRLFCGSSLFVGGSV